MKATRHFIPCMLIIGCLTHPVKATDHGSDIQIRIHSPFADLYAGEKDSWLVRVENRGKETIPVPGQGWSGQGEYPPPQFHVQTKAEADAGKSPTASQWKQIESFGYGMKDLIDKSILGPGQAMEAFSQGLPGELRTPPQGGEFRVAMQVGPDDFVYSNWITRTRHDESVPGMRTLHVGDPWGNGAELQIALSEATHPKYLWFFASNPSNRFSPPPLYRICEVPEGMVPEVKLLDREHGQYVISFPRGGPDTVYFAHRCGLSKSSPWPKGYMSKDFLLTAYPVSAPSPIGFPMDLFREDIESIPTQDSALIKSSDQRPLGNSGDVVSRVEGLGELDQTAMWLVGISFIFLAVYIVFLIRRKIMSRKSIGGGSL